MRIVLNEKERFGVFIWWSVLFHIGLVALIIFAAKTFPPVVKQGEPLIVELSRPDERPAPAGRPGVAPKAAPSPQPKAPTPPALKAPAPRALARATPSPEPGPSAKAPAAPAPKEEAATPSPEASTPRESPQQSPLSAGDQRYALIPKLDVPPKLPGDGEAGGGMGGRGGEGLGGRDGEPVPLDTPDPRYVDYFEILRKKIREKWVIPNDVWTAGRPRNSMVLMIIAKDGRLSGVSLQYASGASGFDEAAITAIKLAAPFPPIPDSISRGRLPITAGFALIIVSDVRRMLLE